MSCYSRKGPKTLLNIRRDRWDHHLYCLLLMVKLKKTEWTDPMQSDSYVTLIFWGGVLPRKWKRKVLFILHGHSPHSSSLKLLKLLKCWCAVNGKLWEINCCKKRSVRLQSNKNICLEPWLHTQLRLFSFWSNDKRLSRDNRTSIPGINF